MSARTAEYLRVMLTPKQDGAHVDQHPSIDALSRNARHLLEVLSNLAYHGDNTARDHAVPTLAKRMGVTAATVRRARAELERAGIIAVERGGSGLHKDVNGYRFPLGAPVEVVPTPRATARGTSSTPRAPARGETARHRAVKDPLDPPSTESDAVPRGGAEPLWRSVIRGATERDDADRRQAQ